MFKKSILIILVLLVPGIVFAAPIPSLNFTDAALPDVLKILAQKAGLNLVLSRDAGGADLKRVTVHLEQIPALEAIDHILSANGYSYQKLGNVLLVSTLAQDLASSAYKETNEVIRLKYLSAQKAMDILSKIAPKIISIPGEASSHLILKGRPSQLVEAKELLVPLDRPLPQILIESKVVEVTESGMRNIGFSWDIQQKGVRFSVSRNSNDSDLTRDILSTLNSLASKGEAQVLANPRIATLDNHEAAINIGSKIPYAVPTNTTSGGVVHWTVQYIDAGVSLKITPSLGEEGLITVHLEPEVSSISEWRSTAAGEFPVISTRNANTTVRVKDGETIVVGGLISESDRENLSKVPLLGDIPLFGLAFQSRKIEKMKTEIVFLITPHVI